jgi:hypothetical protein
VRIVINHFDNPEQLIQEVAREYGLPESCFRQIEPGKIVIKLDCDEEYRIPDIKFFTDGLEEKKFVNSCEVT